MLVSYTQGYGYDYERDQVTDPAAKDIEREKMNGIFHDITEAIGEIQSFGFPKWDEVGKPYAICAIVYHKNKVWQSKVENNNVELVAGNAWAELKADATASDVEAYSKGESDQRFQPLGNYTPSGYSYSKAETDNKYQPKGNYATVGSSYTKAESDSRYSKPTRNSMQKFSWPNNGASPINFGRNCSGKLCIIEFNDGGNMVKSTPFIIPQDTISWMHVVVGGAGELRFNISPTKIEKVQTWYHDVVAVYVEQ